MDTFVLPPEPGDTVTLMVTGTLTSPVAQFGRDDLASVQLSGGRRTDLRLPQDPGVRMIPGDIAPTLLQALSDAIEYAGEQDPEWVAAETLDWVDQYEKARDFLRGYVRDEE